MSKRIIVLGISTFSYNLIKVLNAEGSADVIAVDNVEDRVNLITDFVEKPIIGNATNYDLLTRLDVDRTDAIMVSLGDIESSLITVLYLKDLNAPRIVVRTLTDEHTKILRMLGVHSIVFPEKSYAEIAAMHLLFPRVQNAMDVGDGVKVVHVVISEASADKSIGEIDLEARYGVRPLLIVPGGTGDSLLPDEGYVLKKGDRLVLSGSNENLHDLEKAIAQ